MERAAARTWLSAKEQQWQQQREEPKKKKKDSMINSKVYASLGLTEYNDIDGEEDAGGQTSPPRGGGGLEEEGGTRRSRPRVLYVVAACVERMVAKNDRYVVDQGAAAAAANGGAPPHQLTVFHGLRAPSISVGRYLERIHKYAHCSPACFALAYVYLDRFIHRQPGLPVTSLNIHRLLITSIMVAAKFLDDTYYNNAYYAKVGGVTTLEMNRLELEFLFTLGFRLQVTTQVFESYCCHLEREFVLIGSNNFVSHNIERVLQFSWSFNGTKGQQNESHHPSNDRVARVRCASRPFIVLNLAESVT